MENKGENADFAEFMEAESDSEAKLMKPGTVVNFYDARLTTKNFGDECIPRIVTTAPLIVGNMKKGSNPKLISLPSERTERKKKTTNQQVNV